MRLKKLIQYFASKNWYLTKKTVGYTVPVNNIPSPTRPSYTFNYGYDQSNGEDFTFINNDNSHQTLIGWHFNNYKVMPDFMLKMLKSAGIIINKNDVWHYEEKKEYSPLSKKETKNLKKVYHMLDGYNNVRNIIKELKNMHHKTFSSYIFTKGFNMKLNQVTPNLNYLINKGIIKRIYRLKSPKNPHIYIDYTSKKDVPCNQYISLGGQKTYIKSTSRVNIFYRILK